MRIVALAISLLLADTVVPVAEFRSVELSNGGHVVIRHGNAQRVTIVSDDPDCARIRAASGGRLLIDKSGNCPHGYRLEVEVVTPRLDRVSVSNGGRLRVAEGFPDQASIEASVEQGGSIDIRAIAADSVDASVEQGGGILTTSNRTLNASVRSGGAITYWGEPRDIHKSVRDGGVVQRGRTNSF